MITNEELVDKYSAYSDEELFDLSENLFSYSEDAKKAFEIVIRRKPGGIDGFLEKQANFQNLEFERQRVLQEVTRLKLPGVSSDFVRKMVTSDVLPLTDLQKLVDAKISEIELDQIDRKISKQTITGSLFGSICAIAVGSIFFSLQLIFSHQVFSILVIGIVIVCYSIIRLATKQSKRNRLVFIATVVSSIISFIVGYLVFNFVGYRG